jgi:hypothetical protein
MVRRNVDESGNVANVRIRFIGCQSVTFGNAGIEANSSKSAAKHSPYRIDAARASNVNECKSLGTEAAGDERGKSGAHRRSLLSAERQGVNSVRVLTNEARH